MTPLSESLQNEMVEAQWKEKEYHNQYRKPDPNLKSRHSVLVLPRHIHTRRPLN